ncbi:MAG: Uma2 family endonuclease [Methylococcales bacterium]
MNVATQLITSVDDYLQGELVSDIKHEFVNGDVFAMSGAKRAHNIISMNLAGIFHAHLRGAPCRAFGADMKVRLQTATHDCFFYPDLHVTCTTSDIDPYFNSQPRLIIEVLSESTERYDRSDKFHYYRKLESLEEYVLIAQDTQRVECYRRNNQWDFELYQTNDKVVFESLGLSLDITDIYEGLVYDVQDQIQV